MWKESYRIGIEPIDKQHIELFKKADELLKAIETNAEKEKFKEIIDFLKKYVVQHFHDEEQYQASINYSGIEEHKKAHRIFTDAILNCEKELINTNYDIRTVKDLMGTLTTWLIYHVADADLKIVNDNNTIKISEGSFINILFSNFISVIEKLADINLKNSKKHILIDNCVKEDILIEIGIDGDKNGSILFGFSKEFAFKLLEILTFLKPYEIDELVYSALAETANIITGNTATELSYQNIICNISTPIILNKPFLKYENLNGISVDTSIGKIELAINLN